MIIADIIFCMYANNYGINTKTSIALKLEELDSDTVMFKNRQTAPTV